MECSCCGKGIVEIKWPFSKRESSVEKVARDKRFCLSSVELHYQVHLKMFVTDRELSHFVVWTENNKLYIETIGLDMEFIANVLS